MSISNDQPSRTSKRTMALLVTAAGAGLALGHHAIAQAVGGTTTTGTTTGTYDPFQLTSSTSTTASSGTTAVPQTVPQVLVSYKPPPRTGYKPPARTGFTPP
ncbi:MAG TPA: hypothetical protein VG269_05635 [Tepidisphaeraceae bacterium]|jgi:hypothetical protein|nr:hypothetical protein [Tepidisphaeraceae bacterium]